MRSNQTEYLKYKSKLPPGYCPFCERDLLIQEFDSWIIAKNKFPYDIVAEKHHLLYPKKHKKSVKELSFLEMVELENIKETLEGYDSLLVHFKNAQSLKNHYHLHLIKWRK